MGAYETKRLDSANSSAFNLTLVENRGFHTAIQFKRAIILLLTVHIRSALSVTGHTGHNIHPLYVPAVHFNYMIQPYGTVCLPRSPRCTHSVACLFKVTFS